MTDSYFLKLSGKVNVPKKVEIGHNVRCTIEGSVTSEQKIDNNDGSFDIVSKFEPIHVEAMNELGETIKAKDPRGWSKKLRSVLYRVWEQGDDSRLPDEAYSDTMKHIISVADELYEDARDRYTRQ